MRTSDRTLLASMGFADADRQSPERARLHDLAVRYLMQPDVALAVWRRFAPSLTNSLVEDPTYVLSVHADPEAVLKTGSGFVAGFADLVLGVDRHLGGHRTWPEALYRDRERLHWVHQQTVRRFHRAESGKPLEWVWPVVVEVKTRLDDPGAAVRQMKLYADLTRGRPVLAVTDPVNGEASAIVKSAGIGLAQLGPKFEAWASEDRDPEPDMTL